MKIFFNILVNAMIPYLIFVVILIIIAKNNKKIWNILTISGFLMFYLSGFLKKYVEYRIANTTGITFLIGTVINFYMVGGITTFYCILLLISLIFRIFKNKKRKISKSIYLIFLTLLFIIPQFLIIMNFFQIQFFILLILISIIMSIIYYNKHRIL